MATLLDLGASFVGAGGEGITRNGQLVPERHGVGVSFMCPCGCASPCFVPFDNPLDGGPSLYGDRPIWHREGETLETLTLSPSILRTKPPGCGWHGFVRGGETVDV